MEKIAFHKVIHKATNPLPGSTPERVCYKLSVKKKYEGLPIIDFFLATVPKSEKHIWEQKIKAQNLKVNDSPIDATYKVKAGDLTSHLSDPKTEPAINPAIERIYEDEALLVLNKPAPLPVHASGRFVRNTLHHILTIAFPTQEYRLLHRLDANTTGVIVLAKSKEIANQMRLQFEEHAVLKEYVALVEGLVEENVTQLNAKVGTEVMAAGGRVINDEGKSALTHIEVLKKYNQQNQTLLSLKPETGRTNQIRLHLADLGHPIVGDIGHKDPNYFKTNPFTYPEDSLFLHAKKITFRHPISANEVSFEAPLPDKFSHLSD